MGSGFIVSREGEIYMAITNWHVVAREGNYLVKTGDGRTHEVETIRSFPGIDVAVVTWKSDRDYEVARRGDSNQLSEGQMVHIAGYPAASVVASDRTYRFYGSQSIIGFLTQNNIRDGYELIFTGRAIPGMSGSPILDNNGRVIGIYGKSEIDGNTGESTLFGIPINTAEKLANRNGISLDNIEVARREPQPIIQGDRPASNTDSETLISAAGVDYSTLQDHLEAERWRQADLATANLLLAAAGLDTSGYLTPESVRNLACEDLEIVNRLWSEASLGRYGFSAQKPIYQAAIAQTETWDYLTYREYARQLGWIDGAHWLFYEELRFERLGRRGQFPTLTLFRGTANEPSERDRAVVEALFAREDCRF